MDFLANIPFANLLTILVFAVVMIVLIACILKGVLKGKKIKIGNTEISEEKKQVVVDTTRVSEREIIKKQIHIARAVCMNFQYKIPHYKDYSEVEEENICHKISDEIEDLILFNHISTDESYIKSRFPLIWSVIKENLNKNFTKEDEESLYNETYKSFVKLIGLLLNIRKERE